MSFKVFENVTLSFPFKFTTIVKTVSSYTCVLFVQSVAGVLKVYIQRSKSEFFISVKGPNRNNLLLQNLFLMHNESTLYIKKSSALCIQNTYKCKSGKTVHLSVSIRGRLIWVFLAIDAQYDADFILFDIFGLFFSFIS